MSEQAFAVPVGDGVLAGHRGGGDGPPALLLHGGAAWSDYMGGCAAELAGLLTTHRYTQRGTPPSTVAGPYSIETHMADAVAVLDHFEIDRAWAVGHSWGGHLALHLLVAHSERLLGVVCIDPLGAFERVFGQYSDAIEEQLTAGQIARIAEIEALRARGEATEADLMERAAAVWPYWFADPASAPPILAGRIGVECSRATNESIAHHFRLSTLATGLPSAALPALFVHGERDPMPPSSSLETAALIRGAEVAIIPGCGHFPWMERPGEVRRAVAAFLPGHE